MRRWLAAHAEIAGRRYQAAAEMVLPNAVGHHSRGKRIRGIRDPLRQLQTATLLRGIVVERLPTENFGEPPRHFVAQTLRLTFQLYAGIADVGLGVIFP